MRDNREEGEVDEEEEEGPHEEEQVRRDENAEG
jgi:hypothetical protein